MRSYTTELSIFSGSGSDSPPASVVWSTERRLLEKPPPGAPLRKTGRRSPYSTVVNNMATQKKQRVDRLLLPSRTIDEDDESPCVSLAFRPTRLFFDDEEIFGVAQQQDDPTTVLLVPQVHSPWYDDVDDDDDMTLSPRLFQFGDASLSRFVAIDVADNESDEIFRHREELEEARESATDTIQRRLSWVSTMARSEDEDRV